MRRQGITRLALSGLLLLSACKGSQFPISAGPSTIRCYSRAGASEKELKQALQAVWDKYPENRNDSTTFEQVRAISRAQNPNNMPAVPSGPVTPAELAGLFHQVDMLHYGEKQIVRDSYALKIVNNSAVCYLDIANCGFNCDVCLTAAMLLPPTGRGGLNWEYSVKERAQLETWFEQDLLLKIVAEVRAARKN